MSAKETDFLVFTTGLEGAAVVRPDEADDTALPAGAALRIRDELRQIILWQMAECTVGNRTINKRREQARERAGRAILASVLIVLVLALFSTLAPLYSTHEQRPAPPAASVERSGRDHPAAVAPELPRGGAAADPRRAQGV
jgi:hypothetical protein